MNLLEKVLLEEHDALGLAALGLNRRLQTTLLTPRFPTSRHVVALVFADGDPRPRVVAKIPRAPGDDSGVLAEAEILRHLGSLGGAVPGVPVVLGTVAVDGRTMLVETAVQGDALDPARVAQDPELAVAAASAFLSRLPQVRAAEDNAGWYDRTVAEPLAALARFVPLDGEMEQLCARTHAVLAPLRDAGLPAVFEHGDLSHPNLFLGEDGRSLHVIDWERATAEGLPGHDLVFFLQYASQCLHGADTRLAQLAAFDDAFAGTRGWARPALAAHLAARDVPAELCGPLVVASWARTAATLVSRLGADGAAAGSSAGAVADAVRGDRDVALWWHAVQRAEQGELVSSVA
jgi:aminoglycoside phosphotransferase (APT) family kinase protein